MKRITITLILLAIAFSFSYGQANYERGIGVSVGYFSGISYKHFTDSSTAFEGILSTRWSGVQLTALYAKHHIAFDEPSFNLFYGGGAHVGFWDTSKIPRIEDNKNRIIAGINGLLGLQHKFSDAPLVVSLDWKPSLNLIGDISFWGDEAAITVRYVF